MPSIWTTFMLWNSLISKQRIHIIANKNASKAFTCNMNMHVCQRILAYDTKFENRWVNVALGQQSKSAIQISKEKSKEWKSIYTTDNSQKRPHKNQAHLRRTGNTIRADFFNVESTAMRCYCSKAGSRRITSNSGSAMTSSIIFDPG